MAMPRSGSKTIFFRYFLHTKKKDSAKMKLGLEALVFDIPMPLPFEIPEACTMMTCPVVAGKENALKYTMPIKESFPHLDEVILRLTLTNDDGETEVCGKVPFSIN